MIGEIIHIPKWSEWVNNDDVRGRIIQYRYCKRCWRVQWRSISYDCLMKEKQNSEGLEK